MKAQVGDIIEFLAISWDEPQWEFDHPSAVLKPLFRYHDDGGDCERIIEDLAIDLCCGETDDKDDLDFFKDESDWRGWKLSTLRRVAKNRLAGKDDWKTKIREVVLEKIKFINDEDGEIGFEIIETVKA
jgi:hypothetical protein